MFKGSIVAIVTPFHNGKVDENKLRESIDFQIKNGSSAIVPCGSTGESGTLTFDEHEKVIELTIEQVNKRVPVIAGTGSNNTAESMDLTKHAQAAGADQRPAMASVKPNATVMSNKGTINRLAIKATGAMVPKCHI